MVRKKRSEKTHRIGDVKTVGKKIGVGVMILYQWI